jgi:hypothetical protein
VVLVADGRLLMHSSTPNCSHWQATTHFAPEKISHWPPMRLAWKPPPAPGFGRAQWRVQFMAAGQTTPALVNVIANADFGQVPALATPGPSIAARTSSHPGPTTRWVMRAVNITCCRMSTPLCWRSRPTPGT